MESESLSLSFGGKIYEPAVRTLSELEDVVFDRAWYNQLEGADRERPVYFMYRDLSLEGDEEIIQGAGLRYDVTIVPPLMLGCEYVKTLGHYHPTVPGTGVSYPEAYCVLEGGAVYLLEKAEDGVIIDVVAVRARAGDIVVVPPGYGHITINPTGGVLKMANWVDRGFSSVYEPVKKAGGGAYFLLEDGWKPNPNYLRLPEIREKEAVQIPGLKPAGKGFYDMVSNIERLDFLSRPQDCPEFFEKLGYK